MRLGIASLNVTQAAIIADLLKPLIPSITVYDVQAIDDGTFLQSNDHVMIIDYTADTIMDRDCVLEMLDRNEPKCIMSEKPLYALQHDERLAWRKKMLDEIVSLVPDLADEVRANRSANQLHDIWVIGSSSGGPDALSSFLSALPSLPITLVIAQHIGSDSGTSSLMQVLNNRQDRWPVELGTHGQQLKKGHAYLVPRDNALALEGDRLSNRVLQLPNSPSPSVNMNLRSLRRSTTSGLGVIILTGLGDDGTAALKELKHKTIMVMAQAADDCAARSMPDCARQAGVVDLSDTAIGLAKQLAKHYGVGTL